MANELPAGHGSADPPRGAEPKSAAKGCGTAPGFLKPAANNSPIADEQFAGFKWGLAALGYLNGQTISYERRDAHDSAQALDLAHQLIQLPVDVIVAYGSVEAIPARQATTTIPIVEPALAEALAWPAQALLAFMDNGSIVDAVPRLVEFQMHQGIPVVFNNAPDGQTRGIDIPRRSPRR